MCDSVYGYILKPESDLGISEAKGSSRWLHGGRQAQNTRFFHFTLTHPLCTTVAFVYFVHLHASLLPCSLTCFRFLCLMGPYTCIKALNLRDFRFKYRYNQSTHGLTRELMQFFGTTTRLISCWSHSYAYNISYQKGGCFCNQLIYLTWRQIYKGPKIRILSCACVWSLYS